LAADHPLDEKNVMKVPEKIEVEANVNDLDDDQAE